MTEREKVAKIIDNSCYALVTDMAQRIRLINNLAEQIDAMYREQQKKLREALDKIQTIAQYFAPFEALEEFNTIKKIVEQALKDGE